MTEPAVAIPPPDASETGASASQSNGERARPRAGEPAPPGSFDGRARSFRERESERRSQRREQLGVIAVIAIILLGIYAIVTARPFVPSSGPGPPSPGPPITVNLTAPVLGQVSCGGGGTAYTEMVVWSGASAAVTTGDVNPRVYELWDGDIVFDPGVVANVSSSSLCAGSPPNAPTVSWYLVLSSPNGTIELTYTMNQGWTSVTHGASNVPIENDSALTVVTGGSIAGRGFGLAVVGHSGGSAIKGSVPL